MIALADLAWPQGHEIIESRVQIRFPRIADSELSIPLTRYSLRVGGVWVRIPSPAPEISFDLPFTRLRSPGCLSPTVGFCSKDVPNFRQLFWSFTPGWEIDGPYDHLK